MNSKESFFIKILRWLGLFTERPISKSEMCKQAQDACNHNCDSCAWGERKEE